MPMFLFACVCMFCITLHYTWPDFYTLIEYKPSNDINTINSHPRLNTRYGITIEMVVIFGENSTVLEKHKSARLTKKK